MIALVRSALQVARPAQHLVHFGEVGLLHANLPASEFLESDVAVFHRVEKFGLGFERPLLVVVGLEQDVSDLVLLGLEQGADLQRWMSTEGGDPLADLLGVH